MAIRRFFRNYENDGSLTVTIPRYRHVQTRKDQRNEQDNRFAARLQFSFPDPGPLPEENNEKGRDS
jgi:hypothetical protein